MTPANIQFFESTGRIDPVMDNPASPQTMTRFEWMRDLLSDLPSDMFGGFRLSVRIQSPSSGDLLPAFDPNCADNRLRLTLVGTTPETKGMFWDAWWDDVVYTVARQWGLNSPIMVMFDFEGEGDNITTVLKIWSDGNEINRIESAPFIAALARHLTKQAETLTTTPKHFARALERVFGINPEIKAIGRTLVVNLRTKAVLFWDCSVWLELRYTLVQGTTLYPMIVYRSDHPRAGELPVSQQRKVDIDPTIPPQEGIEVALDKSIKNARELMGLMSAMWGILRDTDNVWEANPSPAIPVNAFTNGERNAR